MERGSYNNNNKPVRRVKSVHYDGTRNNARQQYQDQQGSGTVNNFGGHQVQPSVPAPPQSPMFTSMPHGMPSQIPSGAQPVYSSQQSQMDCYQMQPPPQLSPEVAYYTSYSSVSMPPPPPHVVPVAQGSMMLQHSAPIKMNLATNVTLEESSKTKCCKCGTKNTFWELELSRLITLLSEHEKTIYEKDKCIEEKDLKIQCLENELMSFKASSVNSASVNNIVQNDSTISVDNKTATQSKKQLSADAPEFKYHSAVVPVVSANGDIGKNTKHVDNYHNKKMEDCVENEDGALPRDDDFNNNSNYEEQSEDLKVSNTSVSSITPNDSSSVTTQDSPSYSRATKMVSSDDAKRSESHRSQHSNISVKKKRTNKDRNDSVEYSENKREPSHHSGQYAGPSKQQDNRRVQSNQVPLDRRQFEKKGVGRSNRESIRTSIIKEIEGDLFQAPDDYSLAHCVGQDFRMGSGIAVEFRKRFKCLTDLLSQKVHVGKVAYLKDNGRYIFYLVTKPVSTGKPTYDTFQSAVDDLKLKCVEFGVRKLAMPKIGCGLDRLNWHEVKQYLERTFQGTDIDIMVYYINQAGEKEGNQPPPKTLPSPKTGSYPLLRILDKFGLGSTALVFFATADGHMDNSGEKLDRRFHFADEFKKAEKSEGTVVKMIRQKELIFALIVKNTEKDEFSFLNLEKCLNQLSILLKEAQYQYIAFEAFEVSTDDVFVHKVLTMFCNYVHKHVIEVWVCWPQEVTDVHYQRKEGGNVQYSSKSNY